MTNDAIDDEGRPAPDDGSGEDRIVSELDGAIGLYLRVKARYPMLIAAAAELEVIRTLPNERPFANDAVIQVMRDSFDMLVIDLYSIREMLVMRGGLFALLKDHPERLHVRESSVENPDLRTIVSRQIREAAVSLLQTDSPATAETVTALCSRFIAETKPLDQDRNQVRAHRFEHPGRDTSKLFIELPALQGQIDVVDRYLHDLYLVVTHGGYSMELNAGNPKEFAADVADLIIHGSINDAVMYYGMAKVTPDNPRPWYWYARRETLARLGHTPTD